MTVIEGAVSSQDDLESSSTIRAAQQAPGGARRLRGHQQRAGDAQPIPVRKLLERIYVEGADENPRRPHGRRSGAAQAGRAAARGGEGGCARARLPAASRTSIAVRVLGESARKGASSRTSAPSCDYGEDDCGVGTDEEDHDRPRHAHRGPRQDHDPPRRRGPGRRHAVPRHPGARASRSSPRAARTTRCRRSRRASAASARSATCWLRPRPATPSWRCASAEPAASCASCSTARQFVQSHALSFFHLSAPDLLLGMDSDPAQRNVVGLLEEHPEMRARRHRAAQVRPAGHRGPGRRAHPPLVDRARRRQCAARARSPRADARRPAGGQGQSSGGRWSSARACSTASPKRSRNFGTDPYHVRGPGGCGGGFACTTGSSVQGRRRRRSWPTTSGRATTPNSSARRRCPIRT